MIVNMLLCLDLMIDLLTKRVSKMLTRSTHFLLVQLHLFFQRSRTEQAYILILFRTNRPVWSGLIQVLHPAVYTEN
jgi:hypothetical protein